LNVWPTAGENAASEPFRLLAHPRSGGQEKPAERKPGGSKVISTSMTPSLKYAKVRSPQRSVVMREAQVKAFLTFVFAIVFVSPVLAQRTAVVRGVGTQTCKTLVASDQVDKQFALQAAQWILGNMTGYFRQANDDPSRTIADAILLKTVLDVCKNNPDKTIDEAVTLATGALPATEVQKKLK
jgi:hypothetical protein